MKRNLSFTPTAWDDCTYWQSQDRKTLKRINLLIEAILRDPFGGVGKPEPLIGNLAGFWSRRMDEVNRVVYAIDDAEITILTCRGHYDD